MVNRMIRVPWACTHARALSPVSRVHSHGTRQTLCEDEESEFPRTAGGERNDKRKRSNLKGDEAGDGPRGRRNPYRTACDEFPLFSPAGDAAGNCPVSTLNLP